LLKEVKKIRQRQARIGGKKLYFMLKDFRDKIGLKQGRDRFFNMLRENSLLVEKKKSYIKTTNSHHRFRMHKNLIKDLNICHPNQVYASDITYIRTMDGFCYLSLITDMYSRKIVGYALSKSLSIEGSIEAMKMAIDGIKGDIFDLIHHSDRGVQYCSYDYTGLLEKHNIKISMTEKDHVYENALAERVNGILKDEFMLGETIRDFKTAKKMVKQAVEIYNEERPHLSIGYEVPAKKHAA
jgi:transposase InsO family protein